MRRKLAFESLDERICFALGEPAPGFAQTGELTISYPLSDAFDSTVMGAIRLADGELIVAKTLGDNGWIFTLIKLNAQGQPDNNFGTNGQVHFIDPQSPNSQLVQVVPLADGRVLLRAVVPGLANSITFEQTNLIAIKANGNIDTTFATSGFLRLDSRQTGLWTVVPDRVGGLFVVGNPMALPQSVVTHYTPTGVIDKAFGQAGAVAVPRMSDPNAFVDNQNRLTLWGNEPFSTNALYYRFLSNGVVDNSYGVAGFVTVSQVPTATAPVFADDGESFLRMTRSTDFTTYFLSKYLSNHQLDTSYGTNGTLSFSTDTNAKYVAKLTQLAGGGAQFVTSSVVSNPAPHIVIQAVRITANGSLDTNYGVQGISEQTIASNGFDPAAVSIDALGGFYWTQRSGPFTNKFLSIHSLANGNPDPQFGSAGLASVDVSLQASAISYLQLDPLANKRVRIQSGWPGAGPAVGAIGQSTTLDANGNPVNSSAFGSGLHSSLLTSTPSADGGWFVAQTALPQHGGGRQLIVSRYRSDGTLNTGFGTAGRVTIDTNEIARIFARTAADGSVIIVVDCWQNIDTNLGLTTLVHFKTSGDLDQDFGFGGVLRLSNGPITPATAKVKLSISDVQFDNQSGLIVIYGASGLGPVLLQRFTASGLVDQQFGNNGIVQVTEQGQWTATEIDEDGRIYVLVIEPPLFDYVYRLTQWTARGQAVSSFGSNGSVILPIDPVLALPHVEMETRQGIVVIAASHNPANATLRLVALDYSGQAWSELGPGGVRDYELATDGETVADLEFASDGSLWLGTYEREGLNLLGKVIKLQGTSLTPLRNWFTALDVTADFSVTPLDALVIISVLNGLQRPTGMYPDVNGDGRITALDALLVVNYLNTHPSGEAESEGQGPLEQLPFITMELLDDITQTSGTLRRRGR